MSKEIIQSKENKIIEDFLSYVYSKANEYEDSNMGWSIADLIELSIEYDKNNQCNT